MRLVLAAVLAASLLSAQPGAVQERIFHLTHTPNVQELALGFRSLGGIQELSMSPEQRTITIRGTPDQLNLAEWLFREIDRPAPLGQSVASGEYKIPGVKDDTVRVIHLQNAATPQQLQEMAVNLRTIGNISLLFTSAPIRALALRAPEPNVSFAVWLAKALDAPHSRTAQQYRFPGDADDVAMVSYLAENTTPMRSQLMALNLRTITNIRTMGTASAAKALVMRGTGQQIELGAWLIDKLDPAAARGTAAEWGVAGDRVRVHYLSTPKAEEIAKSLRATGLKPVASHDPRTLILRGSDAVLDPARTFIAEQDR